MEVHQCTKYRQDCLNIFHCRFGSDTEELTKRHRGKFDTLTFFNVNVAHNKNRLYATRWTSGVPCCINSSLKVIK